MHFIVITLLYLGIACAQRSAEVPFYKNSGSLLEITPGNINSLVYNTSYITLLEFYAPWCGYCKQLKPDIEKLGDNIQKRNLPFQVGIVNCDDPSNSALCSEYGIQGFPSLFTVKPKKSISKELLNANTPSKSNYKIEAYNGQRDYKSMMDYLNYMNDSPGFKTIKDPIKFVHNTFMKDSDNHVKPFLLYPYEKKDDASSKKMKLMEHTIKTVQKDSLTKINAFKVDTEAVNSLLQMMCKSEEHSIIQKMCKINEKRGSLSNLLFLIDLENDNIRLFQKNNVDINKELEQTLSTQYLINNYKVMTWLKENITGFNINEIGNGILSPRYKVIQKNIFKNKYKRKNKHKKKNTSNSFDEL